MFYIGKGAKLAEADFAHLADKHGIDEVLIRTVNQVESAGKGIHGSGAVTALYEPHIAWKYTAGTRRANLEKQGLAYPKWRRNYPKSSYPRIDKCILIAGEEVAALSTSWGLGQIMGFNHKAAGYDTAVAMVKAFAESEAKQLEGMINFIKAHPPMYAALVSRDWPKFARLYNGPGYAKNNYHVKLQNAYSSWWKKLQDRPKPEPTPPVEPVAPEKPADKPVSVVVCAAPTAMSKPTGLFGVATQLLSRFFGGKRD